MTAKTKKIFQTILVVAIGLAGIYFMSRIQYPDGRYHRNSILGLLIGVILIGAYQQAFPFAWVYRFRRFINAIAYALGLVLWALPEWILYGIGDHPLRNLILEVLMGFTFGLFMGLFDLFRYLNHSRKTPYSGQERPSITSSATRSFSNGTVNNGRALLLHNRLLFLSDQKPPEEILFSAIRSIEIRKTLGFPRLLTFIFDEAESVTFGLAMPSFWKKKISMAMNLNPLELG